MSVKKGDSVLVIHSGEIGIVLRNNPCYEYPIIVELDDGTEIELMQDQVELSSDDLDEYGYPYLSSPRRVTTR